MQIRVGFEMDYDCPQPTPMVVTLNVHFTRVSDLVGHDNLKVEPPVPMSAYRDSFGNWCTRLVAPKGRTRISADAMVKDSGLPDAFVPEAQQVRVQDLPEETLLFLLGSRYCETDRLSETAWNLFGNGPTGWGRVQAICDWVHNNIEYRYMSGRADLSASEVIERRYGVCRDFAHAAIALCRAFNLPARYVTGHLPDIGFIDPGTPMDFHAYCEVYLGQEWLTFDPRFNVPRIGRVKVAHGADAVDGAFATIYGEANLTHFQVWAYQVNPQQVSVGDPIDLSRRLDGNQTVRLN